MFSRTKDIYIYIYIFVWCSIALSCRTCAPFSLVMNFALIHVKNTGRKRYAKYFQGVSSIIIVVLVDFGYRD